MFECQMCGECCGGYRQMGFFRCSECGIIICHNCETEFVLNYLCLDCELLPFIRSKILRARSGNIRTYWLELAGQH